jgi:hypothetical protein
MGWRPVSARKSYAEITLKSGAVVTFECTSVTCKRTGISTSLSWDVPSGAIRRPVYIDVDEIVAVVFVGGPK